MLLVLGALGYAVVHLFSDRRMHRDITAPRDHTIVCGAGRTGTQVVAELLRSAAPYVLVDVDEKRVEALRRESPHLRLMLGDTTLLFNPSSATRVGAGDTLIARAEAGQIEAPHSVTAGPVRA